MCYVSLEIDRLIVVILTRDFGQKNLKDVNQISQIHDISKHFCYRII